MPLRPEIVGFNLEKMRSHFGSKDESTIAHIVSRLDETAQEIEEDAKNSVLKN